ncbi:variola B22R-like protein [Cheloniid poxvirus 1]|nr:variola B22R-like protein [Cheloniid poxvirus 1]
MDIIIILTIFIAITRSEICRRKSPIYHDTGNDLNDFKERTDYAAAATYGYLSIAEKVHKEMFIESFNWDSILASVKRIFLTKCSDNKGVLKYNYTINMNITVSSDIANGKDTENRNNINKNIIKNLLLYNNSFINQFVNDTDDRAYFRLPVVEHVSYYGNGCNNVTVDQVIVYDFSVGNGDKVGKSPQAKSIIPITFKGVSTHEPYTDSDKFMECVTKRIIKGSQSPKGRTKIDKYIISNCESCTLGLMVDVVGIPEEFNTTLRDNGATPDTLYELLYACMMTNGKDCIDYVEPIEKFKSDTLLSLSSYIKQNNLRVKRDAGTHIDISMEDIMCMYNMYDTRKKENDFTTCTIASNNRFKRGTSEDENDPDDIEISQYLKKIMRMEEVIPRDATHLQVGVSTSYSKESSIHVAGDIDIRAKVKDRAKKTLQSFLPNIPVDTPTDDIYDKINRPSSRNQVPEDSQNILSGRLAAITARKMESVRGVLESRIGYSSSSEDAGYAELQFRGASGGASAGASALYEDKEDIQMVERYIRRGYMRDNTGDNLVENIGAYRQKGGKGVHVVSTVSDTSTGLFDVDTSTLVVSPLTRKGAIIKRNTRSKYKNLRELVDSSVNFPTPISTDRRDDPESPRYHSPSHRRCKRGTNDVVCAMLGQRSRPEGNGNGDDYIDPRTASNAIRYPNPSVQVPSNGARVRIRTPSLQDPYQSNIDAARAMGIVPGIQSPREGRQDSFQGRQFQDQDPYQQHIDAARAMGIVPGRQSLEGRRRHPSAARGQELIYMSTPNMGFFGNMQQQAARPFLNLVTPYAYYDVANSMRLTNNDYDRVRDAYNLAHRPLPRIPGSSRSHSSSHIYDSLYMDLDVGDDMYSGSVSGSVR